MLGTSRNVRKQHKDDPQRQHSKYAFRMHNDFFNSHDEKSYNYEHLRIKVEINPFIYYKKHYTSRCISIVLANQVP